MRKTKLATSRSLDIGKYLDVAGIARRVINYREGQTIFRQGDPSLAVLYLQNGRVKLTVTSPGGKAAIIALVDAGDFFGEGAIAGQQLRTASAAAMEPSTTLSITKQEMLRALHEEHHFSDRFVAHMLKRNVRVEEDLADQLFNSTEKRLARTLLLIARYGKEEKPEKIIPKMSQETLAELVGTTRGHVSVFMNKFRKLGYIKYNGGLSINSSLLRVLIHP
jgi:CRP-like cAMP-binding protein